MGVKNQVALSSITLTFSLEQHYVFPHVIASGDQGTTPIVNKGPFQIWGAKLRSLTYQGTEPNSPPPGWRDEAIQIITPMEQWLTTLPKATPNQGE